MSACARRAGGVDIDLAGPAAAGHIDSELLHKGHFCQLLDNSGLHVEPDLLRVTQFTTIDTRSRRQQPLDVTGIAPLIRHITTACSLVVAYLSGVRTGEARNLLRGCVTRDPKLGLIFMSGQRL